MTCIQSNSLTTGTWVADPFHSTVSFCVRHMGVGKVRGTFDLATSALSVAADTDTGPAGQVSALIDAASVHTGNDQRDAHLRSADFLDVSRYPTIEFTSTEVREFNGATFALLGNLTLHGVTRPVELAAELLGVVADPSGADRVGFSARTTISRAEFGVDIHLAFGAGKIVVADAIDIELDIEFTTADGAA